ncbi:hypothetical protein CQW23_23014 [Capsicum baccatum]|uniref:Uncharacterized protein n=1 Tax=Capsicum baccatum TaxID=33114 RepID=A0A2G2W2I9_CAPBA|nr:hypothetical protein CQW23_23014 [Capsicum baccatum]
MGTMEPIIDRGSENFPNFANFTSWIRLSLVVMTEGGVDKSVECTCRIDSMISTFECVLGMLYVLKNQVLRHSLGVQLLSRHSRICRLDLAVGLGSGPDNKAEGLIDKLTVEAKLHQEKNKLMQIMDIEYHKTVGDLTVDIRTVLEQVKKIREDNPQAFQAKPILDYHPEVVASGTQDTLLEENEVASFEEEAKIVIKRLAKGTSDLDVIPVVGFPGLGETTLAKKISKDPHISFEFFLTIWVNVGPQYKLKSIFLKILKALKKQTTEYETMNVQELAKIIRESIEKGGKCLVVLDDVWTTDIVDSVMNVFPRNSQGHRIMITTRDGRIGRYANANPHMLKFLTNEESFQLLENRVFGSNVRSCPEELVAHGESIAKQCSGVPLGVELIAGVLRGRTRQSEWKMVEDNVRELLININDPKSCLKFVEMSYGHLPEDMKACFLYCGVFPQGFEIPAWKLIRLWISEGLISSNLKGIPEDIAEYYLNDLINRNLVIVVQKRINGQVKTCRLHNMLHHFCKMVGNNGGLFQEVPTIEIKAEIWNMLRLRHLHTNVPTKLPSLTTQKAYESSFLQTLSKVLPESCSEDMLTRACNLRKVSIQGQMADFLETDKGGFNNFQKLKCLEQLKLLNEEDSSMSKVIQLPPVFVRFLHKLKKLTLSNTRFSWSEVSSLGKLEWLEVLKLKENAFSGTIWDSEIGGFSRLKLEAVPVELADVRALQEMTLENTKKAINSAKEIQRRKQEIHQEHMTEIKDKKKVTETMEGFKFKLTIFPPEMADCTSMQ